MDDEPTCPSCNVPMSPRRGLAPRALPGPAARQPARVESWRCWCCGRVRPATRPLPQRPVPGPGGEPLPA